MSNDTSDYRTGYHYGRNDAALVVQRQAAALNEAGVEAKAKGDLAKAERLFYAAQVLMDVNHAIQLLSGGE